MKVITISGKAQNGKDTTAGLLKAALEADGYKVLITHYADLLKYICKQFFGWDGQKDDAGRHILQYVGTDIIRQKRPDYWVGFVTSILELFPNEWDYVLIPDSQMRLIISKKLEWTQLICVLSEKTLRVLSPQSSKHTLLRQRSTMLSQIIT